MVINGRMNNKITNKTIKLILETTFILKTQKREEAVITMMKRMREKEENWMLLYNVQSSRSFLLESWTLYKSIRERIGVCVCVCDDSEWQWNLRETLCVYYARNIIYAQRDVTASIERCSRVNRAPFPQKSPSSTWQFMTRRTLKKLKIFGWFVIVVAVDLAL